MADTEALHPPADRLTAYALGQVVGPERDEIEQHVSSCDSCCRTIEDQPGDSLVLKLLARGTTTGVAEGESAAEPPAGFQVPSSFVIGPAPSPALHDQPTFAGAAPGSPGLAGLPPELNDHPRYRVVAALGAGGMGAVYRAEHRLMDRPVALKVIRGDLLGSAAMVERFRREVKAAARLASHPNIVAAYDAEQAGETHMLVMEFVEGTDLAELVKRRGPLPVGEACEYARQAALGLQHAFEDGMVHRDIKPQNLMRTTRGQVKILDFGLARFASEAASLGGMTAPGMVLGSADYLAPEQIDDPHGADIRADIYSLGCTLYFLLAGRPPFPDGSLIQKLMAHREKSPRPLAEVTAGVAPELVRVVERMMAKDPARRFQTPDEVALALAPFAEAQAARAAAMGRDGPASAGAPTIPAGSVRRQGAPADPEWRRAQAPTHGATRPALAPTLGDEQPKHWTPERSPRRWWAAAALLLLGFVVAWAVVLRVKTSNGTIELVNLPKDAEVLVDGERVAVTWPGGGKPAVVTVTPGKHKIMVKKDGIETSGDELTVQADSKEKFTVRFVPPTKRTQELPQVDGLESIENSIGMTLRRIPAGEFFMGSPDDALEAENREKPSHRMRITRPFYLGVCEVTQGQYEAVMGNNPSWFLANGGGKDRVAGQSTDRYPVDNVSWLDAIQFSNKLSEVEGKTPFYEIDGKDVRVPDWNGPGYRLPTEAEWEYACRANASTPTRFSFGDNAAELGAHGWFDANSEQRTHPVGQKRPNGFGLYDMHGNVWEWCWDWYGQGYYSQSPADDATGPGGASDRVLRGGNWSNGPRDMRSACRKKCVPGFRDIGLGFRVALGRPGQTVDGRRLNAPGSFSPDGRHAVWAGNDGVIRMYRLPAPSSETLKRADKSIVTEHSEAPKPVPTPTTDLLTGPKPEEVGAIARFPGPYNLPEQAGTIVVLAPPKQRSGPSLAYAWDGKSEHSSLLFSRKPRVVQELHSFAIGRDGRQYYLCSNEPTLVEADQDGERKIFTHATYVRDLALDEDDDIYFSEASGAGSQGKIYRLFPATGKAAARAELFCTVDPRQVSGYWDGPFAFGRNAKGKLDTNILYLSSGNCVPAYVFRITRKEGQWSAPTCVYKAGGRIMGLVFTSPATAYYVADNKVFRLTNTGSKVAFTAPDVTSLCHVSIVPEGKLETGRRSSR